MPNHIEQTVKHTLLEHFLSTRSIRSTVKATGLSRTTVRRILRLEGLCALPASLPSPTVPKTVSEAADTSDDPSKILSPKLEGIDLCFLEKLFDLGKEVPENTTFRDHILKLTKSIASEIGVTGATDSLRLELAISQYILFRRFYMKSLKASDANYVGPFNKSHEKLSRAIDGWTTASHRALEVLQRTLKDLEIKYNKRFPDPARGSVVLNQQNIQVNQGLAAP